MSEKALLVISFGTAYAETRKKTIEAVEEELRAAFPDRKFYRAWTSGRIISKVKREEDLQIDAVQEAFQRMVENGVTDVIIQPTYVIQGLEYEKMICDVREAADSFDSILAGKPLVSSEEDLEYLSEMMPKIFSEVDGDDALVLMGHGSPDGNNEGYYKMNALFREKGYPNFRMALVEAEPGIHEVIEEMKDTNPKTVYLAPFMLVAGNHALLDMTGDAPDSWLHLLEAAGYQVQCRIQGLGEYKEIRQLFVQHAKKADTRRI
ncbi:MAG: sirohydrochlorin cobaltochelatase [Lachnospiraceae bacterium]|nr:sirohydrochlorin cobaltochelatase [Lachnospiraceae bacterium]